MATLRKAWHLKPATIELTSDCWNGEKSPSLRTIVNLATALKLKPWEMLLQMDKLAAE